MRRPTSTQEEKMALLAIESMPGTLAVPVTMKGLLHELRYIRPGLLESDDEECLEELRSIVQDALNSLFYFAIHL